MSLMTDTVSGNLLCVLILLTIFSVTGSIGNLLVIVVYAVKHDRLTGTLFILVLAVADFLACVTLIPATLVLEYLDWKLPNNFICKGYYFLNNSFVPFTSLLITCIAFDRYFCICHPFRKLMTLSRAKRVIFTLITIAVVQGICATFMIRLQKRDISPGEEDNATFVPLDEVASPLVVGNSHDNSSDTFDFECTDLMYVNKTGFEQVIYQVIQKSQTVDYIICIISVFVLYILIYRSVTEAFQRKRKLVRIRPKSTVTQGEIGDDMMVSQADVRKSSQSLDNHMLNTKHQITPASAANRRSPQPDGMIKNGNSAVLLTVPVNPCLQTANDCNSSQLSVPLSSNSRTSSVGVEHSPSRYIRRSTEIGAMQAGRGGRSGMDSITMQNMKTASMLFVVTMVYIVSLLPAMLMVNQVVPIHLCIFYLYYVNNAINPFIYGFMNQNFRTEIRLLFQKMFRR